MCGIAGFWGTGSKEIGQNMIRCISYRGPDFINVFYKENVCLSHARLSIIDIDSRSNQPFFNPDKSLAIIFNGEIYNFVDLKIELLKTKHYNFLTRSDTEVLLYAYQEFGQNCLDKIHGMFAFAIFDFNANELFIARDRMGKKPLYYSLCHDGTFVFASELKAVLKHPSVVRELNIEAINQYLTFDYIPTPATINKNVYKLEPAHYLIFKDKKIEKKERYWKPNFNVNSAISFPEAAGQLDGLLHEATRKRLMSDVPLGVFLSGGLDSSTVAYYAQKSSNSQINTFSIGFEDKSYDEQNYALQVSRHLNTKHHLEILTASKSLQLIDEIFALLDEPFADASIIPTYFLSQFTRKHVTVALGGDGSDELLAGYPTFVSEKFRSLFYLLPGFIKKLISDISFKLPVSDRNISFDFKIKQFIRGFVSEGNHVHQLWLGSFLPKEKKMLFKKEVFEKLSDKSGMSIWAGYFDNSIDNKLNKLILHYCNTYLLDDILVKVDRASMYNSLEVRAPFLDKCVVEFLNKLPPAFKQKGITGKYILKKLMEGKLPDNIIQRPKKGFGIPLSYWIRNDLKSLIHDTLVEDDPLFDSLYIKRLLAEHYSKTQNHRKLIWNLFVLKRVMKINGYSH